MRILVVGATGMLGSTVVRVLSRQPDFDVWGTVRDSRNALFLRAEGFQSIVEDVDAVDFVSLRATIEKVEPAVVINCVGIVKQLVEAQDPLLTIPVNALLPHQLAEICRDLGARLIHVSTDCVFSGDKGGYLESDHPDARDLYGLSKLLGEVLCPGSITLRTSIIGPEPAKATGLLEWFLAQDGEVRGFSEAYFSGVTTLEFAKVLSQHVIPNPNLSGLYHLSAERISKYDLLALVAEIYGKSVMLANDRSVVIDRSLISDRFQSETGYSPPSWSAMLEELFQFQTK